MILTTGIQNESSINCPKTRTIALASVVIIISSTTRVSEPRDLERVFQVSLRIKSSISRRISTVISALVLKAPGTT